MTSPRRVVITGMGTVNAVTAGGAQALASALGARQSGIRPVRAFDVSGLPSRLAAEVAEGVLEGLVDRSVARRLSRLCRLTVAACRLSVQDAGIDGGPALGLVVGTEQGDFRSSEEFAAGFLRRGVAGLSPMIFPGTVMNAMAAAAAIDVGARGPTVTVNQATVAGDLAVARAAALIRSGQADAVIAGGVDEICPSVYRRLVELRALSPMGGALPEGCRPGALDHNGPVLGEGATFLVLEDMETAGARGATLYAEVKGALWGNIPAAPHTAPARRRDGRSPVLGLLSRLGVPPERLAACYGSGNGDPALDDWEAALLAAELPPALLPPRSLAPLFGQHGGLGALRVGAAGLEASRGDGAPALVHGLARGGCRTAIVVSRPA
ncbi:MAG: hypothetical protein HYV93_25405 [Candidatus Rokubacteria bacterium]|nr:hypothetical protein [Candidatus Rokubacteria bacterium]